MRIFARKEPPQQPAQPKTTGQALKGDAVKTTSGAGKVVGGIWDITTGGAGAIWHGYTSIFNPKARNVIGATALAGLVAYGAAQEEFDAPSLGDIYRAAKNTTCSILPTGTCPTKDEIGDLLRRELSDLSQG